MAAVLCSIVATAQSESSGDGETGDPSENNVDHFVGVQANPLLRQVLSLATTPTVQNPYLINYTLRFNESNLALSAGVGFSRSTSENDDNLETELSQLDLRVGVGQQFRVSKLLELGYSLDFNFGNRNVETSTVQVIETPTTTDSTYTRTTNKNELLGGGLRANILFYITPKILLGTEASYNFAHIESNFNLLRVVTFTNENGTEELKRFEDESSETRENFDFTLPVSIFLIIKF
jgi:hypothetical protein